LKLIWLKNKEVLHISSHQSVAKLAILLETTLDKVTPFTLIMINTLENITMDKDMEMESISMPTETDTKELSSQIINTGSEDFRQRKKDNTSVMIF